MLFQLPFHNIDPVLFEVGPLQVRWYGLMYMLGFIVAYFIMRRLGPRLGLSRDDIYDLLFYLILGVMVGGRLGYVLFYDVGSYIENPASILAIWRGGMSFHGGFIGAFVATIVVSRRRGWNFQEVADMVAVAAPIGLGLGRIGNFINGELYGRESSLPWAMVFPEGGIAARHPSQLYEALLEGLVLFLAVRWVYHRHIRPGMAFWTLIAGYGLVRFGVEFVRSPDTHIGLDLGPFTRGQLLSFPMLLVGTYFLMRKSLEASSEPAAEASATRRSRPPRPRPKRK